MKHGLEWVKSGTIVFNPTIREIIEMQYQFDEPFVVDSAPMAQRFGLAATPHADALAITGDSYRR